MKKCLIIILCFLFLCLASAAFLYNYIQAFGTNTAYTSDNNQALTLILEKGDSANSTLSKLAAVGIIEDPLLAKVWLKLHPEYSNVKTGYYEFLSGTKLDEIFKHLSEGKVKQFSVTLVEGLTLKQWLAEISVSKVITYDIEDASSLYKEVVTTPNSFCANAHSSLEGCLLADTYFFDYKTKASDIIKRAYLNMQKVIDAEWSSRFLDTTYKNKYEMLIMASIIEKETAVESERRLISGVFDNRLKQNMRLQTDPTVIYGVGESFDGNLTRKHLRQATAYNTYVIKGLPITPIAMAGAASISAAGKPELTEAVYFVAKGDGTHQFSETLEQHNAAVRKYQLIKGTK